MPSTFPEGIFREFRQCAAGHFPSFEQDENSLPREQFVRSSQAVCYRYRACSECNEEFKDLLLNAPEVWREWNDDPEHSYKLQRCLYAFFMNGLSVFESFGFCLYFVGSTMRPGDFPYVSNPKRITLNTTSSAFTAAFPQASITRHLVELLQKPEFRTIDEFRNILAHRLSGMRSVRGHGTFEPDGTYTRTSEDVLHITGGATELPFDEGLIQRHLDAITSLLTSLVKASRQFVKNSKPAKAST